MKRHVCLFTAICLLSLNISLVVYSHCHVYVIEACWKYNHRKTPNIFDVFIKGCSA